MFDTSNDRITANLQAISVENRVKALTREQEIIQKKIEEARRNADKMQEIKEE